jgi:hypothetical protein
MNKELLLQIMTDSFKKANVSLAVQNGAKQEEASKYVEEMSNIIYKCMHSVLDDLLEHLPDSIK